MRCEVSILFNPKPQGGFIVPCTVILGSRVVGELFSYDDATGTGKANIDSSITGEDLKRLSIKHYEYDRLVITPEKGKAA